MGIGENIGERVGQNTGSSGKGIISPPSGVFYYVDKNHPSANDSNPGTEALPWLSIQKAASTIVAGETAYVKDGIYTENGIGAGIEILNSGTIGNPITFKAYPGHRPVVDQGYLSYGFYAYGRHYIIIDGFEVKYTGHGIFFVYGQDIPQDLRNYGNIVQNCYIHHCNGSSNVGGVKNDGTQDCIIRNNIIHSVSNNFDYRYVNSACIFSYNMGNTIIENNSLWNSGEGVFHKQADPYGNPVEYRNNVFHHTASGIYMNNAGGNSPPHLNHYIHHNIFYDNGGSINGKQKDTPLQCDGLIIDHNTIDQNGMPITGWLNVEIRNNIIQEDGGGVTFQSEHGEPTFWETDIIYWDYNDFGNQIFQRLDIFGAGDNATYTNFASWQTACSTVCPDNLSVGPPGPDQNGFNTDPLFVDKLNRDYRLQGGSPLIGQSSTGTNIGAYELGTETIGPDWSLRIIKEQFVDQPLASIWYDTTAYVQDLERYKYVWASGTGTDNGGGSARLQFTGTNEIDIQFNFETTTPFDEHLHLIYFKLASAGAFEAPTNGFTLYLEPFSDGGFIIDFRNSEGTWSSWTTPLVFIDVYDGLPHTVRMFSRLNEFGSTNGVIQVWIDGTLIYDVTNVTLRTQQNQKFGQALLGPYINTTTRPYERSIFIDDFIIYNVEDTFSGFYE